MRITDDKNREMQQNEMRIIQKIRPVIRDHRPRTRMACRSEKEIVQSSMVLIRIMTEDESGGCEMLAATDVMESDSRRGFWRVLEDGIQRLGAIVNKPWLHIAFAKLKLDALSPGTNSNSNSNSENPNFANFFNSRSTQ